MKAGFKIVNINQTIVSYSGQSLTEIKADTYAAIAVSVNDLQI